MAVKKRIIPCLDIMGGRVVKGINFVDLVDVGDPVETAAAYEAQGADELVFLDITATIEGRDTIYELIKRTAAKLAIPFTLGGGIGSIEDFRKVLDCGAAKVSVNSAAVANPQLIRRASDTFGKERIVAAIDAKKIGENYFVYTKGGRENTGLDLISWAKKCEELGAGEILLTSMDKDGTKGGYDIPMTRLVCRAVDIPVIASGGCGEIGHITEVFKQTGCDAALVASLLHYGTASIGDIRAQLERDGLDG
jgi:cyclase